MKLYLNSVIILLTLILNTSSIYASQSISNQNSMFCHGCSIDIKKSRAFQKATKIGFYDPLTELERPTTVYVFDYNRQTVIAYDVWNKFDLITQKPYVVEEKSSLVPETLIDEWIEFTTGIRDAVEEPLNFHDISGYDFLYNHNVRHQVYNRLRDS